MTRKDKIISMDEYQGDDGTVPQWKLVKVIGTNHTLTFELIIKICEFVRVYTMFNDGRSKRLFCCTLLLNQNSISDGTAIYPAANKDVVDFS